jgi:serine protease Do
MFNPAEENVREFEQRVYRRVRGFVFSLAAVCALIGAGFGFFIAGRTINAEPPVNSAAAAPDALSASFAEISRNVEPAVVNIDTKTNAPEIAVKPTPKSNKNEDDDSPISEYFRRQLPTRPSYSVGSGFIVDKTGYILTNFHVVEDATRITVRLQTGEEFIATVVGTDVATDVAVLKINAGKDLPTAKLGDSTTAQVGDWVLAIGSPFGLDQSVTAGIISQVRRETPYASSFQKFIQTDAAINRGNSGGPLVNMRGEVVGINSQIATVTGDYNGIGFALPSNEAAYVYTQILENGKVRRGFLGVQLDSVKAEFAKVYQLAEAKGAIIAGLQDTQSAAGKAGLKENDVIIEFGGKPVESAQDLIAKVGVTPPGEAIAVTYLRENGDRLERLTTSVTLGERVVEERRSSQPPRIGNAKLVPQLGLSLTELTAQLAAENRLQGFKGVFVKDVNPNGIIADVKLQGRSSAIAPGDLIVRINRVPVKTQAEFAAAIDKLKTGDPVVLHVARYDKDIQKVLTRIVQFTFQ